jgi:brefeldin A-inhibited guanine nucleotide-exchange protein
MTREGFIRNNRGICDGQDLPEEMLNSIFDRIKLEPISLKEDDDARQKRVGADGADSGTSIQAALSPAVFFKSHYEDMDKDRENNFQKERDQIVRTTESLLRRKRNSNQAKDGEHKQSPKHKSINGKMRPVRFVLTEDTGLRDEYVAPMFEVTWGPALAAFSTAMESANGTVGALLAIATDEELEHAAENAAETIEVCLTGFRFAICTAGLCGNETARDAFMLALSRFTQLGSGALLEPRHVRCVQTLLALGKDDGELLGNTWEHVFKAFSEIHRFHELFQLMARNDRVAAAAAERRRKRLAEIERRKRVREERRKADESGESFDGDDEELDVATDDGSMTDEELFSDDEEFLFEDDMDMREIDEMNARVVYDAVSEALIEAIYQRSASLSGPSVKVFVFQLCRVSRMEISGYGGHAASEANTVDLTQAHYRQQHTLMSTSSHGMDQPHHNQPNIYNLQKLVEVTHYNMDSRPRLVFSDIWTTVAAHLTSTALHSNAAVAMYAVDSFRQLSIQYLQRGELGGFEFQRKFLKPFETVMAKSEHVIVKELLLKCVERIIMVFGAGEDNAEPVPGSQHLGTLRSGWRPILAVLGLAGKDGDERVAKLGFKMLTGQLRQCLSVEKDAGGVDKPRAGVLLEERFVDLVDALLMYVAGPHEEMSLVSIDHLVTLTTFLADKSFAARRRNSKPAAKSGNDGCDLDVELELWWPILLGISRSMGDARKQVRLKSMVTLLGVINQHFFPKENSVADNGDAPRHGDLQTLQLIFRGVLIPVLEHADSDAHLGPSPPLPDDFERFSTKPPAPLPKDKRNITWLETTFEHFMDGCIAICMRSIDVFKEDTLVEEIFAMLNSCTLSDSGGLGVRGLRRLQQFVTKDLDSSMVTDATWATVCHMLRRCLSVRGLPAKGIETAEADQNDEVENADVDEYEYEESIREFVAEEKMMQDRRYIGSNVTMIIGSLLASEEYADSMGQRWRLFLTSGLGRGVKEWEEAGTILASRSLDSAGPSP